MASVLAVALLAAGTSAAVAAGHQPPSRIRTGFAAPPAVAGAANVPGAPSATNGVPICSTPTQLTANVNTDCEVLGPHNETSIAVNPTNPLNIIGGMNEYQLGNNPSGNSGGHFSQTIVSRAHVTFDGGQTWSAYPLNSNSAYQFTSDPAVAFDASGHAYYALAGLRLVGVKTALNPDIVVANSADGGRTWDLNRVASGSGNFGSVGHLLDKEYIAAWGAGNAIVTYGDFTLGQKGSIAKAQVYSSVTHDHGKTWSQPQLISGDRAGPFAAVPTVAADGRIYVAFVDDANDAMGHDSYQAVEVSPATGARLAGPFTVAAVIDAADDYPHALGRFTYQDSVFRTWAVGNITADPADAAHLAVVWSDMRNSPRPAPTDPYSAVTNSDVIVSQSFDRGRTWSSPTALPLAGDQWMPWGAYDGTGRLRIGTFDRQYDPANHHYGYTLATETSPGALAFSTAQVTTALSDPTRDNRWFATTLDAAFPAATSFIGDYSNIAVMPDGSGVVAYWTDLRQGACFAGRCGHGANGFFAHAP